MHRRQEVHLDDLDAGALALLASASRHIEGEFSGLVAADLGIRGFFVEGADVAEDGGEGGGIGARRAADGALVNLDEFVYVLYTFNVRVRQRFFLGAVEFLLEDGHERLVHQRTLAAAGKARHANETAQRETHVHAFEVVARCALEGEEQAVSRAAGGWNGNAAFALQIIQCNGRADDGVSRRIGIHLLALQEGVQRGVEADLAAIFTGAGPYVHQPVGAEHGLGIVLHHHHRVALVPQSLERGNELAVVLLVQADGRFVQDIEHIHQLGAYLGGQADALAFPSGQ